ncbi:DNA excision repair protein ckn1 [Candida viswanathii]|uniref:DNA excision repair protein ckn1 n=1 Tax=Candida viswanathii TaxID=5486 RepID=A0A367YLE4_9ASCO|nr:DNA excision repair protein ckn1 [Candida viswanathii]
MQSLLLDRKLGRISPLRFANILTESYYSEIYQLAKRDVFPVNCHHNAAVNALSIETSDYQYLLSGCGDSSIKLWDLKEQETVREENDVDASLHQNPSSYDNFEYDNPISTFTNLATIPKKSHHRFGISCIQWWPYDTGMFASSSFDHTVKIWDTNELTPVHTFDLNNRVYNIDTCGENGLIATANDQPFIRLLDLNSTSSAHTLLGHKGRTLVVKWHPINPNLLASGGFDGEVKVWDIRRSNSCLCKLDMLRTNSGEYSGKASSKAHLAPVNGLVWDELGSTLYTSGNDDKIKVWDMVSSSAPPINKLINFGPLIRNKYPQTVPLLLNPKGETQTEYLLFPSESGDIFIFRTIDGKLESRLSRRGSKSSGRTVSMCNAGPFTARYYCGTVDGEILAFGHVWEQPDLTELHVEDGDGDEDDFNERLIKQFQLENERKQFLESIDV